MIGFILGRFTDIPTRVLVKEDRTHTHTFTRRSLLRSTKPQSGVDGEGGHIYPPSVEGSYLQEHRLAHWRFWTLYAIERIGVILVIIFTSGILNAQSIVDPCSDTLSTNPEKFCRMATGPDIVCESTMDSFPEYSCALSFKLRVVIVRDSSGNGGVSDAYAKDVIAGLQGGFGVYSIYFDFDGNLEYLNDTDLLNASPASTAVSNLINQSNNPSGQLSIYIGSDSGSPEGAAGSIPGIATYVKGYLLDNAGIGVVVHEVGHCLGLYHTFRGSEDLCELRYPEYDDTDPAIFCDSLLENLYECGDCVPDTPNDPWLYFGNMYGPFEVVLYDTSTHTCSINPLQPFWDVDINNYMSYYQGCYEHFTPGQVARMRKVIHFVRYNYDSSGVEIDYRFMQNTLSEKLVITSNTTWDDSIEVCTDVYIEAPNKLTITSTASMHSGVKFVVKPGAELRLEGGVMTKAGAGYWKGIEVWGDATATQVPNTGQGKLYIDGGRVEFATEAIVAFNPNAAGGDVESTSGGLVLAFDASFTNNARSAEFRKYGGQNYGRFVNCAFTIDGGHYGQPFREHIKLNGVHGLQFINCTFSNDTGAGNVFLGKGAGILSLDANFTVSGNQTVFRKLRYGVKAGNAASAEAFAIKDATFSELEKGVLATGANHFTITRCTLLIGGHVTNLPPFLVSQEGVQVNYSTGFSVVDNTCLGLAASQDSTVGIKVVDIGAGTDVNRLYGNAFDTLYVGNAAIGDNVGSVLGGGIVYECNMNLGGNTFDFWVQEGGGITENQQSASGEATGNTFSPNVIDDEGHFSNQGNIINYFFDANESVEEPTQYTGNRINLISADRNECSNGEVGGDIPGGEIEQVKEHFFEAKDKHLLYKETLEAALDDGDTPGLVTEVNEAKAWQAATLVSDLLSISPYVSQQVLQAVVDRPAIFTNAMQVDLLEANPDGIRKGSFLGYLEMHSSLNETELATVQAASTTQTARSVLEASVSAAYADKHRAADLVLAYFLLDTAAYQTDSVLAWLDHKGSLHAAYLKAGILFQAGQVEVAQSTLDSISSTFQLTQTQQEEYNNKQVLFQLLEGQASILQMDSLAVDSLSDIALQPGLAGLQAKVLLDYAYSIEMEPNHDLPATGQARTPVGSLSQHLSLANLRVYPNPARESVTFEYTLLSKEKASIRLLNTIGQVVTEIPLSSQTGLQELNVSGLIEGIYWYQLWIGGKSGPVGKLVIQH